MELTPEQQEIIETVQIGEAVLYHSSDGLTGLSFTTESADGTHRFVQLPDADVAAIISLFEPDPAHPLNVRRSERSKSVMRKMYGFSMYEDPFYEWVGGVYLRLVRIGY